MTPERPVAVALPYTLGGVCGWCERPTPQLFDVVGPGCQADPVCAHCAAVIIWIATNPERCGWWPAPNEAEDTP